MNGVTAPTRPVQVVLVDDHVLLRQGLRALLRGVPHIRVVDEAATAAAALVAVARHQADVVVLDIRLGAGVEDGLDLCRRLAGTVPAARILVLTTDVSDALMLAALRAGAHGILLKDSDFASLARAIVDVGAGRTALDHKTGAVVARLLRSSVRAPQITRREQDVLALVARGLSNRAIGEKLAVSETTVKFHLANLMRKTGTRSRAEVVFRAGRLGLV